MENLLELIRLVGKVAIHHHFPAVLHPQIGKASFSPALRIILGLATIDFFQLIHGRSVDDLGRMGSQQNRLLQPRDLVNLLGRHILLSEKVITLSPSGAKGWIG